MKGGAAVVLGGAGLLALMAVLMGGGGAGAELPAAPCGIHGPTADDASRAAILDAWEARGYPRDEASRAVAAESGWHAGALNCQEGRGVAGGLVQMIAGVLRHFGFNGTPAQFASLSAAEQVPYIVKMIARYPRWQVPGDAHLALAAPAFVGAPDETVVYDVGTAAWEQNPGLRDGPDGPITAGSIRRTVA